MLLNIAKGLDRNRFVPSVVLHESRWLHEQLRRHGIETTIIPSSRGWDLSYLRQLSSFCRRQDIDVIHAHLPGASLYGSLVGARLRIPVIATFHNEMFMPGATERLRTVKNLIIRNLVSRIVVVAEFMKDDYVSKGKYSSDKMMTVYNGIDFADIPEERLAALRQELHIDDNDVIVGNVANFRPPKGHQHLIDAARRVCDEADRVKFLLIGEDRKGKVIRERTEEQVADLGLADKVKLLGFREDVAALLRIMDVFVLASISEGLPLSVVEAQAAGAPVVATNVGGLAEIVSEGKSGFLVPPGDAAALAERILALVRDPRLRERISAEGRRSAMEKFSMATMITRYQDLYTRLVS